MKSFSIYVNILTVVIQNKTEGKVMLNVDFIEWKTFNCQSGKC